MLFSQNVLYVLSIDIKNIQIMFPNKVRVLFSTVKVQLNPNRCSLGMLDV